MKWRKTMLVNLKEILKIAEEKKIAIGMFNATGFDSLQAVIAAAEELNQPVIIAHAALGILINYRKGFTAGLLPTVNYCRIIRLSACWLKDHRR